MKVPKNIPRSLGGQRQQTDRCAKGGPLLGYEQAPGLGSSLEGVGFRGFGVDFVGCGFSGVYLEVHG